MYGEFGGGGGGGGAEAPFTVKMSPLFGENALFFVKGRPKSARQWRDSTVAAPQGAERHRTIIPGVTRMSFLWVKVPSPLRRVGLFYLRVSLFTYGWSLMLTVQGLGLFYLRLKFGLVFFAYGGKSVWSFLLTVPPGLEIRFGLFCLRFLQSGNWVWSFLLTVPPP